MKSYIFRLLRLFTPLLLGCTNIWAALKPLVPTTTTTKTSFSYWTTSASSTPSNVRTLRCQGATAFASASIRTLGRWRRRNTCSNSSTTIGRSSKWVAGMDPATSQLVIRRPFGAAAANRPVDVATIVGRARTVWLAHQRVVGRAPRAPRTPSVQVKAIQLS